MRVLITGHKGFVGRHFCEYLGQENIIGIDIADHGSDCRQWFNNFGGSYDLVIHLAAIVGGRQTIENDPLAVATDLSIDAEFFNWVMRNKPKKVIYFSSSAAYPIKLQERGRYHWLKEQDIDLNAILNPDMTYGWAKLTGEYLASFIKDSQVYVFRPFSGYGSDQDTSYPFPSFIDRALRREDPFTIWGDGTQVRDFIHIDDIVKACVNIAMNHKPVTLNLGTGRATSFIHLANLIFEELDWYPQIQTQTDKPVGVHFRVAEVRQMNKYFYPEIKLEEGIRRALCDREHNINTQTNN
jgi:nucleoside-diphosphate-sugar epimerase